jgi:ribosomal protein L32
VLRSSTVELSTCDSCGSAVLQHRLKIREDSVYHLGDKLEQTEERVKIDIKPGWLTPTWM